MWSQDMYTTHKTNASGIECFTIEMFTQLIIITDFSIIEINSTMLLLDYIKTSCNSSCT